MKNKGKKNRGKIRDWSIEKKIREQKGKYKFTGCKKWKPVRVFMQIKIY
jgi:hypothetical protein